MKITDKITITNEDNMDLMTRYPDNYFDLAIVDPPFGIGSFSPKNHYGNGKAKYDYDWNNEKPTKEIRPIIFMANNFSQEVLTFLLIQKQHRS